MNRRTKQQQKQKHQHQHQQQQQQHQQQQQQQLLRIPLVTPYGSTSDSFTILSLFLNSWMRRFSDDFTRFILFNKMFDLGNEANLWIFSSFPFFLPKGYGYVQDVNLRWHRIYCNALGVINLIFVPNDSPTSDKEAKPLFVTETKQKVSYLWY